MKTAVGFGTLAILGLRIWMSGVRSVPTSGAIQTNASSATRAVVVELFTSEGCSTCPPADALLAKLDQQGRLGNAEIVALEEHVDYWDQLGWRDPFSSHQWTERQQDYATAFRNAGVYTPQMVVDGQAELVGNSARKAEEAIAGAAKQPKAEVALKQKQAGSGKVRVAIEAKALREAGKGAKDVWLAVTESGLHSNVLHGENAGEDLRHSAVVRSLKRVGAVATDRAFSGEQEIKLEPAWKQENLRIVVFLQDAHSRHIFGAASLRVTP